MLNGRRRAGIGRTAAACALLLITASQARAQSAAPETEAGPAPPAAEPAPRGRAPEPSAPPRAGATAAPDDWTTALRGFYIDTGLGVFMPVAGNLAGNFATKYTPSLYAPMLRPGYRWRPSRGTEYGLELEFAYAPLSARYWPSGHNYFSVRAVGRMFYYLTRNATAEPSIGFGVSHLDYCRYPGRACQKTTQPSYHVGIHFNGRLAERFWMGGGARIDGFGFLTGLSLVFEVSAGLRF